MIDQWCGLFDNNRYCRLKDLSEHITAMGAMTTGRTRRLSATSPYMVPPASLDRSVCVHGRMYVHVWGNGKYENICVCVCVCVVEEDGGNEGGISL